MTDKFAELDAALERVVAAARDHLSAIKAADGEPDDDTVWNAYVVLNNAFREYDEQLNDVFGEVTPWDLEEITGEEAQTRYGTVVSPAGEEPVDDPHPKVVSVRQRRDYRVPSVTGLIRAAEEARRAIPTGAVEPEEPVTTVAEAIMELLQAGDGSLGMLDVPELEPLDGLVTIVDATEPLDPDAHDELDAEAPFRLAPGDRTVGRLDERPFVDVDDDGNVDPSAG